MAVPKRSKPGRKRPPKRTKPQKKWTVMLYMAATVDDQPVEPTDEAAINDLKELERVGSIPGRVNVVVQLHRRWPLYAQRYRVRNGFSELVTSFPDPGELNAENDDLFEKFSGVEDREALCVLTDTKDYKELHSRFKDRNPKVLQKFFGTGNPAVLRDFVAWTKKNFPADRYLLVLWGHAYGLGFGRDHHDPLTIPELAWALKDSNLDILGANACAMSYVEAAYELRHAARFLVAPEIAMPFAGWPYEKILKAIEPGIEPQALGETIVAEFVKSFRRQDVALTLLNLEKATELDLKKPLMILAEELRKSVDSEELKKSVKSKETGEQIAYAFLDTAHGEVRPLIDLYDLCKKLNSAEEPAVRESGEEPVRYSVEAPAVRAAAETIRKFLEPQKKLNRKQDAYEAVQAGERFIVVHDSAQNLEGLHGVGIYAPSLTGEITLTRLGLEDKEYKKLELSNGNEWADFVYTDLSALLKRMNERVLEFVKGTGATRVEDRTGVAQLLLSVDRSFIKLDDIVTKTQGSVLRFLDKSTDTLSTDALSTDPQGLTVAAARRLSRPYLRLAADFAETRYVGTPNISKAFGTLSGGPVEGIAKALESLEDVAGNVERTIKKVLTNSTLGLGDGVRLGKPDLGKPDLGKPDLGKPDLGKPDLGAFARLRASESDALQQPYGLSAIELFRQVAAALKLLEGAIAEIESDVRLFLTNPPLGTNGDGEDYKRRSSEQLKLSFRALNEVVANARDTVFRILADPSQGLGPAPEQRSVGFDRQNLALAGGLSALGLSLL
jgi:Clostripain family